MSTGPINYSLDQAVQYFQEHYNQPLSIKEYAAAHNLSEGWFIQNFKQYTNSTPAQYLLSLRIHNAKVLLESTNYNVTEISNIIGYENPLYFSRIFKKQTGFSPSEYRKKIFSEDNSTHSVSITGSDPTFLCHEQVCPLVLMPEYNMHDMALYFHEAPEGFRNS